MLVLILKDRVVVSSYHPRPFGSFLGRSSAWCHANFAT